LSGFAIAVISFKRGRAYLLNHLVNNVGSFVFGYIYVSIWRSALGESQESSVMVTYLMVNQSILWVTMFLSKGAFIPQKIREGTITFDLLRPYNLLYGSLFEVIGQGMYNLLFRSLPIFALGLMFLGVRLPEPSKVLPFCIVLFNGFLISFFLNYFVGLWSVKFLGASGAQGLYYMLVNLFGGSFLPASYYPGFLKRLMPLLPFAGMNYYPASVYLGSIGLGIALAHQVFWICVLFITAVLLTRRLLRSIQIHGG